VGDETSWYRDAVIYQAHVRAYQDTDDNGIGDFDGLTQRLDYLQDLGVTAIWLLPFYPSPLRDDGYDIADYKGVHPAYGTLGSFRRFLREAHRRDLRVITELVINHTSDQHPWFQRARNARAGTRTRDFYVWSDTDTGFADARIIFPDFESSNWAWDPVAEAYYWHRFYSHQPDLNFHNPAVHEAVVDALDFWFNQGVDGLRLDAIPYLYEREGTTCENLPETHEFLRALRAHVDEKFAGRMLLAEANQWPEDAVEYFGKGDECHMAFHFPLMPRLYMALQMEDRFPITEIMEQTPSIPDGCQWATFLRNHDELTLEMVTDEERDYMWRVYARDRRARVNVGIRRRLAPLLQNDRRRIELMNALLFSLPGTPIVYYGDEIGMGDNVFLGDRNSVRTPMQWSPDRNAGFSRANPHSLYLPVVIDPEYHYEKVNVEVQSREPSSLLRWMRQLIALRSHTPVLGRGSIEFLTPENPRILAFVRELGGSRVLVVANLSRSSQHAELDLGRWVGLTPTEMFGGTPFPPIGTLPYLVTLGPYGYLWFELVDQPVDAPVVSRPPEEGLPVLHLAPGETSPVAGRTRARLARLLPAYLAPRRWFGGKSRSIRSVQIVDAIPIPGLERDTPAWFVLAEVDQGDGSNRVYALPLALSTGERGERIRTELAHGVVAEVRTAAGPAVLSEALWIPEVAGAVLALFRSRRPVRGERGELHAIPGPSTRSLTDVEGAEPRVLRSEQSNTSVVYGDRSILKLFRRIDPGPNPELELGSYLAARGFDATAPFGGALEYRQRGEEPATVAVLQGFVANEGDGWSHALAALSRYLDSVLDRDPAEAAAVLAGEPLLDRLARPVPDIAEQVVGSFLDDAVVIGARTAQLHAALAAATGSDMAPVIYTQLDRRSLYQSMRSLGRRTMQMLERARTRMSGPYAEIATRAVELEPVLLARFQPLLERPIHSLRIRTHGDYHLGQLLWTGRDYVILDFEGEPARSIGERRLRRSSLRDVAGMMRSLDYAARTALEDAIGRGLAPDTPDSRAGLGTWIRLWTDSVSTAFLRAYLDEVGDGAYVPQDDVERALLLDVFLLEKALYEVVYELDNRPTWVHVPLAGLVQLLDDAP
jgi:maltose alpha-D-glucosyltransferase/alpha-amylase